MSEEIQKTENGHARKLEFVLWDTVDAVNGLLEREKDKAAPLDPADSVEFKNRLASAAGLSGHEKGNVQAITAEIRTAPTERPRYTVAELRGKWTEWFDQAPNDYLYDHKYRHFRFLDWLDGEGK